MPRFTRYLPLLMLMFSPSAFAGTPLYLEGGVAIDGYDAVAYHTEQKAVEGSSQHSLQWNNGNWHFASEANKELFAANPEKYAPRYGGFCAYAASQGYFAPTDPDAWTVKDGKLYMNYSKSVRKRWLKNVNNYIVAGDLNWPNLKSP